MAKTRLKIYGDVKTAFTADSVKPHESARVNEAFMNITEVTGFCPIPEVAYIWAYTIDKEIIIGIENPWLYPQAFAVNEKSWPLVEAMLIEGAKLSAQQVHEFELQTCPHRAEKKRLRRIRQYGDDMLQGRGHPSITSFFNNDGQFHPEQARIYLAGELYYRNNQWILNNISGRYGKVENTPHELQTFMHEIAIKFELATSIRPKIHAKHPLASQLEEYYTVWEQHKDDVENALALLNNFIDLYKPTLFMFTNPKYKAQFKLVSDALSAFQKQPPQTIADILAYFENAFNGQDENVLRPLLMRLDFIAGQTNNASRFTSIV